MRVRLSMDPLPPLRFFRCFIFLKTSWATGVKMSTSRAGGTGMKAAVPGGVMAVTKTLILEGIFPLELAWVLTPFPPKLFRMRV